MPGNRSLARDIFIWDLNSDNEDRIPLGGLVLTAGMTNTDFRQMLDILLLTSSDCLIQNQDGDTILRDDQPLRPGHYTVIADTVEVSSFTILIMLSVYISNNVTKVNDEEAYTRATSITTAVRAKSFTEQVQARDGRCVVSKVENTRAPFGMWTGFEAAHIFPLAYQDQWVQNNYGRWITIDPPRGAHKIHSVQNGILLRTDLHQLFDQYIFSINPDVRPLIITHHIMYSY